MNGVPKVTACLFRFSCCQYLFIYSCFSKRGRVNQGRSQWQTQIKESRSTKIKSGLAHHFFALYLFSESGLRFLSYYRTAPRYIQSFEEILKASFIWRKPVTIRRVTFSAQTTLMFHSKITQPFPQKSHECSPKLTDLWIKSLLFD